MKKIPVVVKKRREAGAQEKRRGARAQLRHEEDPSGDGEKTANMDGFRPPSTTRCGLAAI